MPSISVRPSYPIAGKACQITASATAGGNVVKTWCTNAPPGSELRKQLDTSQATQIIVATAEVGKAFEFTPDKGGAYQFTLQEIQRGNGFTGGYDGDPRGAPSETILEETNSALYVASPLTCTLGFGPDTATLRLFVAGANIIATSADQHGLVTPTIEISAQATAKARTAAESAEVRAALAELVGSASSVLGSPGAVIADLVEKYNSHRTRDSSHEEPDDANTISEDVFSDLTSAAGQRDALNRLRDALSRHIRNVDPASATQEPGSAGYHNGVSWGALPHDQISAGQEPLSILVAAVDTWRAYESHRVNDVHTSRDIRNRADELPALLTLHRRFIAQLVTLTPATPPTGHSAASLLASSAGFRDA